MPTRAGRNRPNRLRRLSAETRRRWPGPEGPALRNRSGLKTRPYDGEVLQRRRRAGPSGPADYLTTRLADPARLETGAGYGSLSGRTRIPLVSFSGYFPVPGNVSSTKNAVQPSAGVGTLPTHVFGPLGCSGVFV